MARGAKYHPKEKIFIIKRVDAELYVNNPDDKADFFLYTAFRGMAKTFTLFEAQRVKGHLIIREKQSFKIERQ